MKIYLKTVTVCAILMGSVLSSAAYAQCALKPEWIEAATRLPSIQIPAAIPVDSNTPVGRVIWRTPVPAPNPQFITNINIGCNGTMSATGLNNGVPGEPLEPNQVTVPMWMELDTGFSIQDIDFLSKLHAIWVVGDGPIQSKWKTWRSSW